MSMLQKGTEVARWSLWLQTHAIG